MKVKQLSLTENNWRDLLKTIDFHANLCLLFVSPDFPETQKVLDDLKSRFPDSTIIGCSTAGEISDITVKDETIALTAIQLEKTAIKKVAYKVNDMDCSQDAGVTIANSLIQDNLKHVIVLSDGLNVNGAELVSGLKSKLTDVSITGGLAADGSAFNKTFVIDDQQILDKTIVGIGFMVMRSKWVTVLKEAGTVLELND